MLKPLGRRILQKYQVSFTDCLLTGKGKIDPYREEISWSHFKREVSLCITCWYYVSSDTIQYKVFLSKMFILNLNKLLDLISN